MLIKRDEKLTTKIELSNDEVVVKNAFIDTEISEI